MYIFSTRVGKPLLSATSDVKGFSFDRAIEKLIDLALIDVQQEDLNAEPDYTLHPLVRSFVMAKIEAHQLTEATLRANWIRSCIEHLQKINEEPSDTRRRIYLDSVYSTLRAAIEWSYNNKHFKETIELAREVHGYLHVRGLWEEALLVNNIYLSATREIRDEQAEFWGLVELIQILSRQREFLAIIPITKRTEELSHQLPLSLSLRVGYHHALALHCYFSNNIKEAKQLWTKNMALTSELTSTWSIQQYILSRRYVAVCFYKEGLFEDAKTLLHQVLSDAERWSERGYINTVQIILVEIDIATGNFTHIIERLRPCLEYAIEVQDRRRVAEIYILQARYFQLVKKYNEAKQSVLNAVNILERMGRRHELLELQVTLRELESSEGVAS